jgi:hypothetical protein
MPPPNRHNVSPAQAPASASVSIAVPEDRTVATERASVSKEIVKELTPPVLPVATNLGVVPQEAPTAVRAPSQPGAETLERANETPVTTRKDPALFDEREPDSDEAEEDPDDMDDQIFFGGEDTPLMGPITPVDAVAASPSKTPEQVAEEKAIESLTEASAHDHMAKLIKRLIDARSGRTLLVSDASNVSLSAGDLLPLYHAQANEDSTRAWWTENTIMSLLELESTTVDGVYVPQDMSLFVNFGVGVSAVPKLGQGIEDAEAGEMADYDYPMVDMPEDTKRILALYNPSATHWVICEVVLEAGAKEIRLYNSAMPVGAKGSTLVQAEQELPLLMHLASLRPGSTLGPGWRNAEVVPHACTQQSSTNVDCGPLSVFNAIQRMHGQPPFPVGENNMEVDDGKRRQFGDFVRAQCVQRLNDLLDQKLGTKSEVPSLFDLFSAHPPRGHQHGPTLTAGRKPSASGATSGLRRSTRLRTRADSNSLFVPSQTHEDVDDGDESGPSKRREKAKPAPKAKGKAKPAPKGKGRGRNTIGQQSDDDESEDAFDPIRHPTALTASKAKGKAKPAPKGKGKAKSVKNTIGQQPDDLWCPFPDCDVVGMTQASLDEHASESHHDMLYPKGPQVQCNLKVNMDIRMPWSDVEEKKKKIIFNLVSIKFPTDDFPCYWSLASQCEHEPFQARTSQRNHHQKFHSSSPFPLQLEGDICRTTFSRDSGYRRHIRLIHGITTLKTRYGKPQDRGNTFFWMSAPYITQVVPSIICIVRWSSTTGYSLESSKTIATRAGGATLTVLDDGRTEHDIAVCAAGGIRTLYMPALSDPDPSRGHVRWAQLRAIRFTKAIIAHLQAAHDASLPPVLVSMGIDGFTSNTRRMSDFLIAAPPFTFVIVQSARSQYAGLEALAFANPIPVDGFHVAKYDSATLLRQLTSPSPDPALIPSARLFAHWDEMQETKNKQSKNIRPRNRQSGPENGEDQGGEDLNSEDLSDEDQDGEDVEYLDDENLDDEDQDIEDLDDDED